MAVTLEIQGAIAIITLDRPEKRNALTQAMLAELERIADSLRGAGDVRAVVLRANGNDFSVGADIGEMEARQAAPSALGPTLAEARRGAQLGARVMRALMGIDQPTICAVQGISTGGATCIATACDFRIAASAARLGYGEVKIGIPLMWNALGPLVALVGPARAKRLVMSGALVDAATLAGWGLIDEIVPADDLDARALATAADYAALPPLAVQMIKRSINAVAHALDAAVLHADADQWLLATRGADFAEAVAAFRDKRPGRFTGN
ncbi:enoyl-CoA hydratase/isomerase family protein [Sandarakinorhabdus rubra]|uniref:enoyl-CoA hydratase/isomerase family protein n=1 Tax=Sandarakinorhabdus rubra TaxID=2672568 RepID=UPI0013DC8E43|nr:enoyl-CoA hydratase/isomerase family protein [Sandarakinorhabdus rubra]